ncbi:MAG: helix-turn-helix transcriptional regulator, partial [Nocardioidaceae bacterium]
GRRLHRRAATRGCDRCAAEASLRTAEVFARLGQPDTASSLLADWDEGHQDPVGQYQLWRTHVEGLVVAHRDPVAAAAILRSAHAVAETQEAELERVWVDLDLGRVLAPVDRDGCVEVLRGAATSAHEMQAASEEQRALQLLRSVGVRTWRRGRAAAGAQDGLTERERSIAQLVCQGASNPEIAETLFLSRKTIERHVSNVFAKTGVRNRAELVARISSGTEPT